IRDGLPTNDNDGTTGALGVFRKDAGTRLRDITDGTSNTVLVGERAFEVAGNMMLAGTLLALRDNLGKGATCHNCVEVADGGPGRALNQGLMQAVGQMQFGFN